jgi:flagellar biosynthetic protein FliQ
MTAEMVVMLGREAIVAMLTASAPMLIAGLVVGLLISILQAITQIHEMTLTFIPKIVAVALALLVFLPWIINLLVSFTVRLYGMIPSM